VTTAVYSRQRSALCSYSVHTSYMQYDRLSQQQLSFLLDIIIINQIWRGSVWSLVF